jgi:hypothetical protein
MGILAYTYGDAPIKLWHDDIRRPPDDTWTWARTNKEALDYLYHGNVVECSLDHDLGLHDIDPDIPDADTYFAGVWSEEDGYSLVEAMIAENLVPPKVTIHSWNPPGAARMARRLKDVGVIATVQPYARATPS